MSNDKSDPVPCLAAERKPAWSTVHVMTSALYKVMEGAAYLLMIRPDATLEKRMDEIIDVIADAQQDDGYLYVSHICKIARPREMGQTPYSWVVHSLELYNIGHMIEGAVAYYRATGKDQWLAVAEKHGTARQSAWFGCACCPSNLARLIPQVSGYMYAHTDDYGLEKDRFNVVRPGAALRCDAIRIRILPQVGSCMGVHEIRVEFER